MILYRTKYYGILTDRVISTAYDHIHKKIGHRQDKARALERIRSKVIENTQDKLYEKRDNFHEKVMNKSNELHNKLKNGEISFEDWKSKKDLLDNLYKNHQVDINKKWDSYNRKVDYLDSKIESQREKENKLWGWGSYWHDRKNYGKENTNERTLDILLNKENKKADDKYILNKEVSRYKDKIREKEENERKDLRELENLKDFLDHKQWKEELEQDHNKRKEQRISWNIFDSQKRKNENKILNHNEELNKEIKLESNQLRREIAKETREYNNPELFNSVLDSINNSIKMNPDDFSVKIDGKLKPLKITVKKGAKDAHYNPTTHEIITPPDPAVLLHELTHAGINTQTTQSKWGWTNNPVSIKTSAGFVGGGRYNPHISKNSPESILNYKTSTLTEEELANKNAMMELYLRGASPADLDHAHKIGKFSNKSYRLHMGDNYSSGNQLL